MKIGKNNGRKILIIGAGVIGSIYGGKLAGAGNRVTFLARGERLKFISQNGIQLKHALTGREEKYPVEVLEKINDEKFDITIVAVRKNQLESVKHLVSSINSETIIFMINNPLGFEEYHRLARERAVAGFPAAGGWIEEGVVYYYVPTGAVKTAQSTTFGELKTGITRRLKELKKIFTFAGFNTALSPNMDSWQKTHVALVSPIANAIYKCGNSNYKLAKSPDDIRLMINAVREGFKVIKKSGYSVTPSKLKTLEFIPEFLLIPLFRVILKTRLAETVMTRHAVNARDEMKFLADEFISLRDHAGYETPAIDELNRYI